MARIHADDCKALGITFELFRLDTGERLRRVRWLDLDAGVFCQFRIDPKIAEAAGLHPDAVSRIVKIPFRYVEIQLPKKAVPGKPEPLPGELLQKRTTFERCLAVQGRECQYPGCHHLACWKTANLQEVPPQVGEDGERFERTITTGFAFYCERAEHYRAPVMTSLRGVESEIDVQCARPQW